MAIAGQHAGSTHTALFVGTARDSDHVVQSRIRVAVSGHSSLVRNELEHLLRKDDRFALLPRRIGPGSPLSRDADVILVALHGSDDIAAFDDMPGPPLVVLADQLVRKQLVPALGSRVFGILASAAPAAQICAALESAAAGLVTIPADDWELVTSRSAAPEEDDDSIEALTPREAEVLALMARGLGNKKIAARLNISEHTAKFHVSSILGKLGARSRTEAVAKGLKQGLLLV